MLVARSAFSRRSEPTEAAREVADGLAGVAAQGRATAAVFFATEEYGPAFEQISRLISSRAEVASVVGCTAAQVVTEAVAEAAPSGRGISALAIGGGFEAERFFLPGLRGRSDHLGHEIGRLASGGGPEPTTVLLLADSYNLAPDELLAGISDAAGPVPVIGAGATEKGSVGETMVVAHGATSANAVAGLVLRGVTVAPIQCPVLAPVGPWWTVTAAEANRIRTLDGEPALQRILLSLPETLREKPEETLAAVHVAIAEPEAVDTPLLRPIVGADPERGTLAVGDEVLPGTRIALAVGDPATARGRLEESLSRLKADRKPDALLYFQGALPGEAPYGLPGLDTAYLHRERAGSPLAGFASYVIFSPRRGRNRYHHFSGLVVGLTG